MSLTAGTRLGPYEILTLLGAGGMGEVYRARDTRLGRDVALKVLPDEVANDLERLSRFEREARSASSLSDPHIVAVFDVGQERGVHYIASELVEGSDLRIQLGGERLPIKKALDFAEQIASGLAAAHERGIVHRDLKPENILITKSGLAKIADFGLAKQTETSGAAASQLPTSDGHQTSAGVVMGTVAYMSPEQARGAKVDFRSDQFAFGLMLYELLTGRQAFKKGSAPETLAAIIREEPEPVSEIVPETPAPILWILERCLAKNPDERYGSTRDLARDLANVREGASQSSMERSGSKPPVGPLRASRRQWLLGMAIGAAALASGFLFGTRSSKRPEPTFSQVTFRRGSVLSARFSPMGDSIVYGAAWEGKPFEIFSAQGAGLDSRSLGLESADLLSISRSGEMAISVKPRLLGGFVYSGTLARVDLSGGAPREILERVYQADWTPDGKELAVSRPVPGGFSVELPPGKPLFSTTGWIGHLRVSPDGRLVAFLHHPVMGDDRGEVVVVDRGGSSRVLARGWTSVQGLAWRPDGREVWFTATRTGTVRSLRAVTLAGRDRIVASMAASLVLQDIAPSGRVLLTRTDLPVSLLVRPEGAPSELNLAWLDASILRDVSADGKTVVFSEAGAGGGPNCSVFLRRVDTAQAIRLGEGWAQGLSRDGKSVLAIHPARTPSLLIYPVGPGTVRSVEHPGISDERWAEWLPDGRRILFAGRAAGRGIRIYVQDAAGGEARPVTPEGVGVRQIESPGVSVSPDGEWVAVRSPADELTLYPVGTGAPRPVAAAKPGETPVGWSRDASVLYVSPLNEVPAQVVAVALADGRRTAFRDLVPSDPAGVAAVDPVVIAPDGKAYGYSCLIYLSTLYLGEGLQ